MVEKGIIQNKITSAENGSTLPLVALIILGLVGIVALVVDTSREEISLDDLQIAAEAAALAGAKNLDGTEAGWRNSKRAVIATLKQNDIYGSLDRLNASSAPTIRFNAGDVIDEYERVEDGADTSYSTNQARVGNLLITLERGVYWHSSGSASDSGFVFKSLEQQPLRTSAPSEQRPMFSNVPVHIISNALKVTIALDSLQNTFGKALGQSSFDNLARSAVAVFDTHVDECVAPIAIPACALLLDTNPNHAKNYEVDKFVAADQCQREAVATETDPYRGATQMGIRNVEAKAEGRIRSASYPRLPFAPYTGESNVCLESGLEGERPNCKAIPLNAVLGTVSEAAPRSPATAQDVTNVFSTGCVNARLGQYFQPLEDDSWLQDATRVNEMSLALANFITTGDEKFKNAFGDPTLDAVKPNYPLLRSKHYVETEESEEDHHAGNSAPRSNYSFNNSSLSGLSLGLKKRKERYETQADENSALRISWPMEEAPDGIASMIMGDMSEDVPPGMEAFTNPMCHDPALDPFVNNLDAPVRSVMAMVIAPEETNGNSPSYCDYRSLFNFDEQNSVAPAVINKPKIVGFTKIYVYDFNVRSLEGAYKLGYDRDGKNGQTTGFPPELVRWTDKNVEPDHSNPRFVNSGLMTDVNDPLLPSSQIRTFDRNPGRLEVEQSIEGYGEYLDQVQQYVEDIDSFIDCTQTCVGDSCSSCAAPASAPELAIDPELQAVLGDCFEIGKDGVGIGNLDEAFGEFTSDWNAYSGGAPGGAGSCFSQISSALSALGSGRPSFGSGRPSNVGGNLDVNGVRFAVNHTDPSACWSPSFRPGANPAYGYTIDDITSGFSVNANQAFEAFGNSKPGMNCLPFKFDGAFPANSPSSWQDLEPRRSGSGCGGVRLRLSCSDSTIPSGRSITEAQVALVE